MSALGKFINESGGAAICLNTNFSLAFNRDHRRERATEQDTRFFLKKWILLNYFKKYPMRTKIIVK